MPPSYGSKEILDLSLPMTKSLYSLQRLFDLVARLRGPEGCPWDQEQEIQDLRAYLLEEAHEVAAAIDNEDWREVAIELGDLLFQLVFVTRLAEEQSAFSFTEVVDRIEQKMISRHPHVFGDEELPDSAAVHRAWEKRKLTGNGSDSSLLGGIPSSLPALLAAYRMTQKAAGIGFDWANHHAVLDKVDEELEELRLELDRADSPEHRSKAAEELGDLLFTLANLARHLGLDPEAVLAAANNKFRLRFRAMEARASAEGISLATQDAEVLEDLWEAVKRAARD